MTLKEMLMDYCAETSFHGIGHIKRNSHLSLKLVWIVIFGAAIVPFMVGLKSTVSSYRSKKMGTSVTVRRNRTLSIPTVAIGLPFIFDRKKIEGLNISKNFGNVLATMMGKIHPAMPPATKFQTEALAEAQREYDELKKQHHLRDFEDFLKVATFDCTDFIEFAEGLCEDAGTIYMMGFKVFTLYLPPINSAFDRRFVGIRWPDDSRIWDSFFPVTSAYVGLSASPGRDYSITTQSFSIEPGTTNTVLLRKTMTKLFNNPPQYACVSRGAQYDQYLCEIQCAFQRLVSICGCIPLTLHNPHIPTCDPFIPPQCSDLRDLDNATILQQCEERCPPSCVQEEHTVEVGSFSLNRELLAKAWDNESVVEDKMRHTATIAFSYMKMEYTEEEQFLLMGFFEAVSYLGGLLGLFCGGSVLTFVHIFLFCCSRCKKPSANPV